MHLDADECASGSYRELPCRRVGVCAPRRQEVTVPHEPRLASADADALELDARMRTLNAREAACRIVVGELAEVLRRTSAHRQLGFARLADYTRERLGLSSREIESLATVTAALRRLPATGAAFTRGDLSWTRTRLITAVADPEDEAVWLEHARRHSTVALAAAVKRVSVTPPADRTDSAAAVANTARPVCTGAPSCATRSSESDTTGRPQLTASADRSRRTDDAVDEALDRIGGERAVRFRLQCPPRVRMLFYDAVELARRVAGETLPIADAAEAIAAEALSGAPRAAVARASCIADVTARAAATNVAPEKRRAAASAPAEAATAALGVFELDARLCKAVRALRIIDCETGRVLETARRRLIHRVLGFRSFANYLCDRTATPPRTARALIAAERAAAACVPLGTAYRAGEISWLQTLTLAPAVVGAPEGVAIAWVTRARLITLRRLTDEVAWALARCDGGARGPIIPPPVDAHLVSAEERQIGALSTDPTDDPAGDPPRMAAADAASDGPLMTAITFTGPASVVALFRIALAAFATTAAATPRGGATNATITSTTGAERGWRSCERMLRHVCGTWHALPRHRDPVFERDGWRCSVPACSGRRNLHDHHLRFRSRGGDNRLPNRVAVCAWHHLRAIHLGVIRGWGTVPDGVRWQLGIHGTSSWALLDFLGDRYLADDEILAERRAQKQAIAGRLAAWVRRDESAFEM